MSKTMPETVSTDDTDGLVEELKDIINGEVRFDRMTRAL